MRTERARPRAGRQAFVTVIAVHAAVGIILTGLGAVSSGARADDAAAAAAAQPARATTGDKKLALLELFSSQGCSSCPPAEDYLGQLAAQGLPRSQVVAVGYHVDYWDRLGWKDPFSDARWTERQKVVARALRQDSYYTPELVWDGRGHSSDPADATRGLKTALGARARARLTIEATPTAGQVAVTGTAEPLGGGKLDQGLVADAILLEDDLTTEVPDGENRGRTLHETAVVRDLAVAATVDKDRRDAVKLDARLAIPTGARRESLHVAVTLRDPKSAVVWQALDVALVTSRP